MVFCFPFFRRTDCDGAGLSIAGLNERRTLYNHVVRKAMDELVLAGGELDRYFGAIGRTERGP